MANEAAILKIGISSIMFGIIYSGTSMPFKFEDLTKISPTSSFELNLLFFILMLAPIYNKIFNSPFLVLFSPTFFIKTSEFFEITEATIIKAADEKSPGIVYKVFGDIL